MGDLESRVVAFLDSLPGSEVIDSVIRASDHPGERRADFLLRDRSVVLELKALKADPSPKVESEIDKHRKRPDFPLFFGSVILHKILRHLPDGESINRRIFGRVTSSVNDAVRSAEEQIEGTVRIFKLKRPVGVLMLLNQDVEILGPDVVVPKIRNLLDRHRDECKGSSPIDFAWCLFESHVTQVGPVSSAFPSILIDGPGAVDHPWFESYFFELQQKWAEWNNATFVMPPDSQSPVGLSPSKSQSNENRSDRMTRQQGWERDYELNPYLRKKTDQEVFSFGARAFAELTPTFMKGGPSFSPDEMQAKMRVWSDFLCEARFRGLDLRGFHVATLLLIALLAGCSSAHVRPASVSSGLIAGVITKQRVDENSPTGFAGLSWDIGSVVETNRVPAQIGTAFGSVFTLTGPRSGSPIKMQAVWHFPPGGLTNPATGKNQREYRAHSTCQADRPCRQSWRFTQPFELVTGPWTLEAWADDTLLFREVFEVYASEL